MHRKLFVFVGYLALLAAFAAPANAERIYVYRYGPPPTVIYEPAPAVVSYDPDDRYAGAYNLQGVVTGFVPYHMTIRIHDDFYPVALHDGTIIKPVGITLTPSMIVHVDGYWSGATFVANKIVVLR
ncbi:MAG: hypothetical protein JOZ91_12270 [Candidatus Eremiobacteraeota bacterium]|nr:hypothetical protein [Candidatus Eremiobacteraeota bacterium]MBV8203941.1 hypothetical protein [Candidatus Eremiobacteraeota bacterium]MBV8262880.1 hypothetical protein [Candidatus Eremiobacteraeota bacterium]MBV8340634.1 hypothetical protein [Candidatus Eremiobacteraeota bacterium]MBV8460859.1 hypothetical protein [Candidatus Eremiobacteraeota bacterium]